MVGLASLLATRAATAWAGFVAAAPITPTLAVLGSSVLQPQDLLNGLPIVAGATGAMAAALLLQRKRWMPTPALVILVGIPLLLPAAQNVPAGVLFIAIALVCLTLDVALPIAPQGAQARRFPWYASGILGGLAFAAILTAASAVPAIAPLVAMYPALLVISLAAIRFGAGPGAALRVCRAALGANVAVATFAATPALFPRVSSAISLVLAWIVFALIAGVWPLLVRALRMQIQPAATPTPSPCPNQPCVDSRL